MFIREGPFLVDWSACSFADSREPASCITEIRLIIEIQLGVFLESSNGDLVASVSVKGGE